MTQFLISLDELERVKAMRGIKSTSELAELMQMGRSTVTRAVKERRPTPDVLNALAKLGANPARILVAVDAPSAIHAA